MWDAVERCRNAVGGLADAALPGARGEVELAALLAEVDAAVLRELAGGRPAGEPPPACRAGCAACCTLNVATLAAEGAVAAAFLRERLGAAPAAALGARLAAFHDRVRWLEDGERIAHRETCPLLDGGGRCLVHPVRPLACRSVSSLDADECRRAMSAGAEDEEEGRLVRMDLLQRALYAAALGALGEALARRGLDARCRDVSGMTGIFLGDASLGPAFLAGRRLPIE
jgi:Fe-S-cluster containining protein